MKTRYRLICRGIRGGAYYCVDTTTGKRTSLGTTNADDAKQIIEAKNNSERQPVLNLQIAKAYLAGSDNGITTRTWQQAIESLINTKQEANQHRWRTAARDRAFVPLLPRVIIETPSELLLKVLESGTVSTNVYLRRLHNFCVDMNWLPWPLIPKRQWPAVRFKEKRAITWEEHCKIVAREKNPERKAFYQLAWHLGASQSDLAFLEAENVDLDNHVISYARKKTGSIAIMRMDADMEEILRDLPGSGPLFPYLRTVRSGDRATEFKQRCTGLGIKGVSLHSYRYAWAERAKTAGYPERFAQVNLGHNSRAMTRAYSRKAPVEMPSLSEYERQQKAIIENRNTEPAAPAVAA
ncbi:MAG TPA: tyrosine-type recombinase/integrase [Candidatus Sulfopaludibacter sp.]|nr:tyrosine-type recombinase/integrase [Candidatus Sulfopaludibacter sp.]